MKRLLIVVLGIIGIAVNSNSLVQAEVIDADSKIVAVTVFPDRALVSRKTELKLEKGAHTIRFGPLPGSVEADSVSAKGEGSAKVTLFGAKLIRKQIEEADSPRISEIENKILQLSDQRKQLESSQAVLRQERKFLESIQAASSDQIGKDIVTKQPQVSDLASLLSFIEKGLTETYQKEQESSKQIREIDKEIDKLTRELSQLRRPGSKQQTFIEVDIESANAGSFALETSYRIPNAIWIPIYEARANIQDDELQLTAYGLIRQKTGEDWEDVSIRLSTARPSIGGRIPEVRPWWLRKREVLANRVVRSGSVSLFKSQEGYFAGEAPPPAEEMKDEQEAFVAEAAIESRGAAMLFSLPRNETILSDWQPRKSSIFTKNLPTKFLHETTPRLSPYVFLRANSTNNTDSLLLPGQVQIFLDGAFVGTSSIDLTGPQEQLELSLGVDERIRLERKQTNAKVDVSILPGISGRTKTIEYSYLITLENFTKKAASVKIVDQIPVSQHDEIIVDQVSFSPEPSVKDKEKPGVVNWLLEIAPGGKQTIKLAYRVKHPISFTIEGL